MESDPSVECIMRGVKAMNAFQPDVIIAHRRRLGHRRGQGHVAVLRASGHLASTACASASWTFANVRSSSRSWARRPNWSPSPPPPAPAPRSPASRSLPTRRTATSNIPWPTTRLTPGCGHHRPAVLPARCPKSIVADTGLDVLTHAIEAYVSVMASDYTDGLALHAIEMVFTYLEKCLQRRPTHRPARRCTTRPASPAWPSPTRSWA